MWSIESPLLVRARARTRERLFSPAAIATFALLTAAVLIAIFPHKALVRELSATAKPDLLTVTYGKAVLKTDPDNAKLRMALLRLMIQGGYLRSALDMLQPLHTHVDASVRDQARMLELEIFEKEIYAEKPDSEKRALAIAAAREKLGEILREEWPPATLAILAEKALALQDHQLAIATYERAAAQRSVRAAQWLAQAGRLALAIGEYRRAAALYFAAQEQDSAQEQRREHYLAGVRSLQSGNLPALAFNEAVKHGGTFQRDREILTYVETLRRQAGDPARDDTSARAEELQTSTVPPRESKIAATAREIVPQTAATKRISVAGKPAFRGNPTQTKKTTHQGAKKRRVVKASAPAPRSHTQSAAKRASHHPMLHKPSVKRSVSVPLRKAKLAQRHKGLRAHAGLRATIRSKRVDRDVRSASFGKHPDALQPRTPPVALPLVDETPVPISPSAEQPISEEQLREPIGVAVPEAPAMRVPEVVPLSAPLDIEPQVPVNADRQQPAGAPVLGTQPLSRALPWRPVRYLVASLGSVPIIEADADGDLNEARISANSAGSETPGELLEQFKQLERDVYATSEGSAARREGLVRLNRKLSEMLGAAWNESELQLLASKALGQGNPGIAIELYDRLAREQHGHAHHWHAQAAKLALMQGDYRGAALRYFAAQAATASLDERREYFIAGVKSFQAGNLVAEAWREAELHLGTLVEDRAALEFVVRLARAADQTRSAEPYVDRLLRRTGLDDPSIAESDALNRDPELPAIPDDLRAFDQDLYALAFDVYAGSGKLDKALGIAHAAVVQRAGDPAWRKRLAQVAEWSGKPTAALKHWRRLVEQTGSDEALQAAQRLAVATNDDESAIALSEHVARQRNLSDEELAKFVALAERGGEVERALTVLDLLEQRGATRPIMQMKASLLEHSGQSGAALKQYRRLAEAYGANADTARKLFLLSAEQGSVAEGYELLRAVRDRVSADDRVYWETLANAAWSLRDDATAIVAYRHLVDLPPRSQEAAERLIQLLGPIEPGEAAALAEARWQDSHNAANLITALALREQALQWQQMGDTLQHLTPGQRAALEGNRSFLLLRGQYYQHVGDSHAALQDLERALALDTSSIETRLALFWLAIDQKLDAKLRGYLQAWAPLAKQSDAMRGAFAAGYMALGEARRAVPHYLALLKSQPDDYLWLLNYADALEQSGSAQLALRVRRHAWLSVRPQLDKLASSRSRASHTALLEHARSLLREAPGDPSYRMLGKLLQDSDLSEADRAAVNELALAWQLSNESYDAARGWLWKRYARAIRAPLYAQVALALEAGDRVKLDALLTHHERELTSSDKIEMAKALEHTSLARDYAHAGLSASADNDNLHAQVVDTSMPLAATLTPELLLTRQGALSAQDYSLALSMPASERLRVTVLGLTRRQASRDENILRNVPAGEQQFDLQLDARDDHGQSTLRLGSREANAHLALASVSHRFDLAPGVALTPRLARNQAAEESIPLKIGGVKDLAGVAWTYNFSKREYLYGDASYNRYYSQERHYLGAGQQLYVETGHRFRSEYPDFTLRAGALIQRYRGDGDLDASLSKLVPGNASPTSDFFIPRSSSQLTLGAGWGESARDNYSRALRPFASAYAAYSNVAGAGYSASVGLASSIVGTDRLQLQLQFAQDLNGNRDKVQALGFTYRYNF